MTIESASVTAIVVAAAASSVSIVFGLVRAFRVTSRLKKSSASPGFVAATRLPAQGERIAAGVQRLRALGDRWNAIVERLTAAQDASDRLSEGVASVSACVIGLLDAFAPSLRGRAS